MRLENNTLHSSNEQKYLSLLIIFLCIISLLSLIICFSGKIFYSLILSTCKKPSVLTIIFAIFVWIFPIFHTSEYEVSKTKSRTVPVPRPLQPSPAACPQWVMHFLQGQTWVWKSAVCVYCVLCAVS